MRRLAAKLYLFAKDVDAIVCQKKLPFLHFLCMRVRSQSCGDWPPPPGACWHHCKLKTVQGCADQWIKWQLTWQFLLVSAWSHPWWGSLPAEPHGDIPMTTYQLSYSSPTCVFVGYLYSKTTSLQLWLAIIRQIKAYL